MRLSAGSAFLGGVSIAMIEDYHGAVADAWTSLVAFQNNIAIYPRGSIQALAAIPRSRGDQGSLVQHRQYARQPRGRGRRAAQDRRADRQRHLHSRGHADGVRWRAHRVRRYRDRRAREHAAARRRGPATEAYEVWNKLGPLARICWRAPLRDYRVRMKYVLMKQGVLPNMHVRAPFPALAEDDRRDIDRRLRDVPARRRPLPARGPDAARACGSVVGGGEVADMTTARKSRTTRQDAGACSESARIGGGGLAGLRTRGRAGARHVSEQADSTDRPLPAGRRRRRGRAHARPGLECRAQADDRDRESRRRGEQHRARRRREVGARTATPSACSTTRSSSIRRSILPFPTTRSAIWRRSPSSRAAPSCWSSIRPSRRRT